VPAVTVTSNEVTHGKPHPEGYLAAFARLGVDPPRGAIFEDSDGGLVAAMATGATVIRVGSLEPGPGQAGAVEDLRGVSWDAGRLLLRRASRIRRDAPRKSDH
jgi:sugar-phosphatase